MGNALGAKLWLPCHIGLYHLAHNTARGIDVAGIAEVQRGNRIVFKRDI
jgi:hypothetical protein